MNAAQTLVLPWLHLSMNPKPRDPLRAHRRRVKRSRKAYEYHAKGLNGPRAVNRRMRQMAGVQ